MVTLIFLTVIQTVKVPYQKQLFEQSEFCFCRQWTYLGG